MLRYLTAYVPDGFTTNLVRYPVGTVIFLPFLITAFRNGTLRRIAWLALLPAAFNILGQTLWAIAPYHVNVGTMAFLVRLCAVWSIVTAFLLFPDERRLLRSPRFWIGAALAVAGFVIMARAHLATFSQAGMTGVLIMFFCGLGYGLYYATARYAVQGVHPLAAFCLVGVYSSVVFVMMAPLGRPSGLAELPPFPLALLILSALIGVGAAHGMYFVAVRRIGVTISALTLSVTPFVSIVVGRIFLGETFSTQQWVGGLILTAGATLAAWSEMRLTGPDAGRTFHED